MNQKASYFLNQKNVSKRLLSQTQQLTKQISNYFGPILNLHFKIFEKINWEKHTWIFKVSMHILIKHLNSNARVNLTSVFEAFRL